MERYEQRIADRSASKPPFAFAWRTGTIPVIRRCRNLRAIGMQHIRHGGGAVRPYIYALPDTIELIRDAFDATELERLEAKNGFHIEARIGDSVIVLEAADPPVSSGTISSIYVYVPDVDQAFQKALASGATSISEPEDKPYQERGAGVRDAYGNTWWISTYTG